VICESYTYPHFIGVMKAMSLWILFALNYSQLVAANTCTNRLRVGGVSRYCLLPIRLGALCTYVFKLAYSVERLLCTVITLRTPSRARRSTYLSRYKDI
jgi:hypothetical protein